LNNRSPRADAEGVRPITSTGSDRGFFWEIRSLFGRDRADALFFQTWSEKLDDKPTDTLWRRFAEALVKKAAATMGQSEAAQIATVFKRRGLTLEPSAARG
jgi:hypothetical protein